MDLTKCYICRAQLEFSNRQALPSEVAVDDFDNMGRLCHECNIELNGKVALVVEEHGIRTEETVFLPRRILDEVSNRVFPPSYCIYLVPRGTIKEITKRILKLR